MWKNYLVAALRNVGRNRLYTAVNVGGLTVAFAAALLIALYTVDQLSYDRFIRGHASVYRIVSEIQPAAGAPGRLELTNASLAALLASSLPEIESITRLKATRANLRAGEREYVEEFFFWADPSLLDVLPLKVIAGDAHRPLDEPGSVILTRRMALKYFGRADVVGQTLEFRRRQPLRITAVLEDLPPNTHLNTEILASGRASFSALTIFDARTPDLREIRAEVYTYFRLKPGASRETMDAKLRKVSESIRDSLTGTNTISAIPLTDIHFAPAGLGVMKPADDRRTVETLDLIGMLIVLMAAVNFVNLMTARSIQRALEVGVRKASGAGRAQLIVQFVAESLLYVVASALLAVALVEILLPHFDALLGRPIGIRYRGQPAFGAAILGTTLVIGVLAGIYPAYVISRFNPSTVLYGKTAGPPGSARLRKALTLLQYATLVGLAVVTVVMYRQTRFALDERLRVPTDQVAMIRTSCRDVLRQQIARLPGVNETACSSLTMQNISISAMPFRFPGGGRADVTLRLTAVDDGLLELFSLAPLAGRFLSRAHAGDLYPIPTGANRDGFSNDFRYEGAAPPPTPTVLNETAIRVLHFESPQKALGQVLHMNGDAGNASFVVVGVSPDLPIDSVREPVQPTVYYLAPKHLSLMYVKLSGNTLPTTLAAIGEVWKKSGDPQPLEVVFLDRYVADLHQDIVRQARVLMALTCTALVVACLGLLGLATYSAERRGREVGIRKALGADSEAIARLMLWDLVRPLLLATVLAWPLAFYCMDRWLNGFVYRIELSPWMFVAASAVSLALAVATVLPQVLRVSRGRPVEALRHS